MHAVALDECENDFKSLLGTVTVKSKGRKNKKTLMKNYTLIGLEPMTTVGINVWLNTRIGTSHLMCHV